MIKKNGLWIICLAVVGVMIIACDNTLDPIDKETGIYAIYGFLDLDEEINYIRVRDLNAPFTAEATQDIDAVVTLENLESGTTQILESTVMEYEGVFLHNFQVNGKISSDTQYRLTAKRSDGVTVSVLTTTPTMPEPSVVPTNQDCYIPIDVKFEPTNGGTIVLRVGFQIGFEYWLSPQVLKTNEENPEEKISYTFTPREQLALVPGTGGNLSCHDMRDDNFYINYIHYSPGFYEKISNDPFDILASTERFGALYEDTLFIPIDTSRVCPQDC